VSLFAGPAFCKLAGPAFCKLHAALSCLPFLEFAASSFGACPNVERKAHSFFALLELRSGNRRWPGLPAFCFRWMLTARRSAGAGTLN
jgi:hypothetical protein